MVCTIDLDQNPEKLSDAQESMDGESILASLGSLVIENSMLDFTTMCESEGYPIDHIVVTLDGSGGGTETVIADAPPLTTSQPSTTSPYVFPWVPSPTTVTTDGAVIWYGGQSFGMSANFATGTSVVAVGSVVFPGFTVAPSPTSPVSSDSRTQYSQALANNSGAYSSDTTNSADTTLNPSEDSSANGASVAVFVPFAGFLAPLIIAAILTVSV